MALKRIRFGAAALFFLVLCHGGICDTEQYCKDFKQNPNVSSDVDEYCLHRVLKEGLARNFTNLYNIQKANLKQKSDSKIACLSVKFELLVNQWIPKLPNDGNCSLEVEPHDNDQCPVNVKEAKTVFLWSSFDTSTFFGSLLLAYTVYDLRAFGFGWEGDCELYQAGINISISIDKIPCVTKDELCSALQYITTLLPAYSIAQNISTETEEVGIGYAHPRREYNTNSTDAVVFLIAFGNMVLSKVIIITLVTTYYDSAVDLMRWKISPVYYFFWGCHCTTFWVFIVGNSFYIAWTQENKAILSVPGLSALIDFLAAIAMLCAVIMKWWPSTRVTDLLPVPLTACFRTCFESNKPLQYFLNFVAFFFTFFFISSLLRIFPNLLISYYAFPSRTLIHIGFFQVSFVCLVVAFGGLIFLLEKCAWLVHIKKHGKIPEELNSVALIRQYIDINEGESRSPSVSESSQEEPHVGSIQESHNECGTLKSSHGNDEMPASPDTSGGASIAVGINQQPKLQLNSTLTESDSQYQNIEYLNEATLKNPIRTFSSMSFQILTALLLLVALFLLIIVIGIIVSANTVDKDSVQAILTLLPTVVVDIVIVLTRKKFFNNRVALEYRLARVVEDTPEDDAKDDRKLESNNETTPLLRKNRTYNR